MRRAALLLALLSGCSAVSQYQPRVLARGELTVRYDEVFELWSGGKRVSRGLTWTGLEDHVECVPLAREHARMARVAGQSALAFSILGGTLGVLALGGLVGLADKAHQWEWLGSGLASGAAGLGFAIAGHALRPRANGHAIDAHNFYNDAVGSLGATCADLKYPPPAGPHPINYYDE